MKKNVRHLPARDQLLRGDEPVRLATAEADLLRVFAANPGETMSRQLLSECLGGGTSYRAIDVQIARLRGKIEPEPQSLVVCRPSGAGVMCCEPIEPRRPPGERAP